MQGIFVKILDMSFVAGITITVVCLARLFLRRAPKWISYVLWLVVLFRLLCPFSITSGLSLIPVFAVNVIPEPQQSASYTEAPVGTDAAAQFNNAYARPSLPDTAFNDIPDQNTPAGDGLDVYAVLSWIWFAGAAVTAGFNVVSYISLKQKLLGAVFRGDGIFLSDNIASPFVFGIFKPRIYLPLFLDGTDCRYIILHERHHIKRLDNITRMLATFALCLHWFNPLVWLAFSLSAADMEMSCDEAVLKKLGGKVRAEYCAALLNIATGGSAFNAPLAFGEGMQNAA